MDRIFICILIGFFISLVVSPLIIKFMRRLKANQTIYEYVDMHKGKANTPTMGGIIFIFFSIISSFCVFSGDHKLATVCIVCMLAFGILGFLDDFLKIHYKRNLGLKAYQKIIGQVAISIIIAVFAYKNELIGSEILIPFTTSTINLGWWYIPFCIFVFLATTNAVNLTDGLDGLAGGVSISYLFGFVFISFAIFKCMPIYDANCIAENTNLLVLCGGVIGSLLAYLLFNSFPATIFMGDTGSLALGGLISAVSICSKQVLLIPILGAMFVLSVVSVIIQVVYFHFTQKRVFLMAPFHHHLEKKGMYETKIVVIYIVVTLVICVSSILLTLVINY